MKNGRFENLEEVLSPPEDEYSTEGLDYEDAIGAWNG